MGKLKVVVLLLMLNDIVHREYTVVQGLSRDKAIHHASSTDCISNVGYIHVHVHTCMHVFMHRCGFTHVGSTPETRLHPGTVRKAHLQQVLSTCNLYMYMYMYMYMLCVQCTCTHICTIPAKVVHMHTYTRVHVHMKRLRNITI